MIIAIATNDHRFTNPDHFGDALMYDIYEVNTGSIRLLNTIENNVEDTKIKTDKAIKILELIGESSPDVLINKAFGSNIVVISRYALPVVFRNVNITSILGMIQENIEIIEKAVQKKQIYLTVFDEGEIRIVEKEIK